MNISEKKLEKCIRPLPYFSKEMENQSKKDFRIECHKFFKKMLLDLSHLEKNFFINENEYKFLGLISENTSAVIREIVNGVPRGYYEVTINLVQECFDLFYKSYTSKETLKFHNIELNKKPKKEKEEVKETPSDFEESENNFESFDNQNWEE